MSESLGGRRAEAARNDVRVLRAAREVLTVDPDAPMSEIARHAGVGVGTLYRRYAGREALVVALCLDGVRALSAEAARALEQVDADPWGAFAGYMTGAYDAGAGALGASVMGSFTPTRELVDASRQAADGLRDLLARAQAAGCGARGHHDRGPRPAVRAAASGPARGRPQVGRAAAAVPCAGDAGTSRPGRRPAARPAAGLGRDPPPLDGTRMTPDDRQVIRELVESWAVWRDALDWDRFRTVWHEDGRMMATWWQGPYEEFIRVSREGFDRGVRILHFLGGGTVDVEGDRAIAQTKMTISQRAEVEGVVCDVVCTGRFYDFFERRGGRWGLVLRQPIYERDRLDPVDPTEAPELDPKILSGYPEGYRHLAYLQQASATTSSATCPG